MARKHSDETIAKIRAANTGKTHTDETRSKMSKLRTGRVHTDETKEKIRAANIGKSRSEETLAKMRKPKRKLICPHCNAIGGANSIKRYHFDKCKLFNSYSTEYSELDGKYRVLTVEQWIEELKAAALRD